MSPKLANIMLNTLLLIVAIVGTPIAFLWYGVKGTIQWWQDFGWK